MEIAFREIETEFNETFGYVRQDIAKILEKDLSLNYTIALLVCCACEMLTWHRGLKEDQAYKVFTSLLPNTQPYEVLGKTLWEALRNGLAHKFRPDTVRVGNEEWRFTIFSSHPGPLISVSKGQPNWIRLNIRELSSRVIARIEAFEQELRTSANARLSFCKRAETYVKKIHAGDARITKALRSLAGETHP